MSVTNSRTDCCLVDLIDATLAVEDVKSKPVDVDAFADVKRVLKMGLKVTAGQQLARFRYSLTIAFKVYNISFGKTCLYLV